jgi:diketogulonate reductase-like aldo/keto reductase
MGTTELSMQYIKEDMAQLGVDHVDLLLIHSPGSPRESVKNPGCGGPCKSAEERQATYRALEQALAANLTRAIGASGGPSSFLSLSPPGAPPVLPAVPATRSQSSPTDPVGVSNFNEEQLVEILATAETPPALNQCSMHLGGHDDATIKFCLDHGITYAKSSSGWEVRSPATS